MRFIKSLFAVSTVALALNMPAAETKKETAEKPAKTADAEKDKPAADKPKAKKIPFYGKVVAVTQRTLTIKSSDKSAERKIAINAQTKIVKEKEPVTSQEIVVGRWVGGSLEKNADGGETAALINLSAKQKEEKPAKPEGGETKPKEDAPKKAAEKTKG